MALHPHSAAFPCPAWESGDGLVTSAEYGMAVQHYATIEMAKALIGRKDSMIFNKAELAREALEMANAILEVL